MGALRELDTNMPAFKYWLWHLLAEGPLSNYLASLILSFSLLHTLGIIISWAFSKSLIK
jgi:beta-xylosidase